ncbi:MAG: acyl carrier protein [Gemmatimonadota bacterium]
MSREAIIQAVKEYILATFLPGEDPKALSESTQLITGGILDSLATLELVSFLEQKYGIELQAHEVDAANLGTLANIATLVRSKAGAKA